MVLRWTLGGKAGLEGAGTIRLGRILKGVRPLESKPGYTSEGEAPRALLSESPSGETLSRGHTMTPLEAARARKIAAPIE